MSEEDRVLALQEERNTEHKRIEQVHAFGFTTQDNSTPQNGFASAEATKQQVSRHLTWSAIKAAWSTFE